MRELATWFDDFSLIVLYDYLILRQFLLFGWGCVFWQAVALQYGRRPVYLITLVGTMVGPQPMYSGSR